MPRAPESSASPGRFSHKKRRTARMAVRQIVLPYSFQIFSA